MQEKSGEPLPEAEIAKFSKELQESNVTYQLDREETLRAMSRYVEQIIDERVGTLIPEEVSDEDQIGSTFRNPHANPYLSEAGSVNWSPASFEEDPDL